MSVQKIYLVTSFVGSIAVMRFTNEDFIDDKWVVKDSYYAISGPDFQPQDPKCQNPGEAIALFKKELKDGVDRVVELDKERELEDGVIPDDCGYEAPKVEGGSSFKF